MLVTESTIQVKSRVYQEPHVPEDRPTAFRSYHRAPVLTTPPLVQCAAGNLLGPNNLLVSWSEGTLSG
jgi:hypothetical protein